MTVSIHLEPFTSPRACASLHCTVAFGPFTLSVMTRTLGVAGSSACFMWPIIEAGSG